MSAEIFVAPFEAKAAGSAGSGEFEGYGAVFGNVDGHGDVILPGAFAAGLAELSAAGRKVAMHLHHGLPQMGGRRGVGVWTGISEDTHGLHVKGRIAGMNTETGRHLHAQIVDGALTGLSIGYAVRAGGADHGMKASAYAQGARRALKAVNLAEVSIVDDPSNARSLILQVKALLQVTDSDAASAALGKALSLHAACMSGGDAPTAEERAQFLGHLQDAHEHLTGRRSPAGLKSAPTTVREMEEALRDAGLPRSQARRLAAAQFKPPAHRDDAGGQASEPGIKAAMVDLATSLSGFTLNR